MPADRLEAAQTLFDEKRYAECATLLLEGPVVYLGAEVLACEALLEAEDFPRLLQVARAAIGRPGQDHLGRLHLRAAEGLLGKRWPYAPPAEHAEAIRDHLWAAVREPDAPAEAFRLFAIQLSRDPSDLGRRRLLEVLTQGVRRHPESTEYRLAAIDVVLGAELPAAIAGEWLADMLPEVALVDPALLTGDAESLERVPNRRRWLAYNVERARGNLDAAAAWALAVVPSTASRGVGRQLLAGTALLEAGRLADARTAFEEAASAGADASDTLMARLGLAAVAYAAEPDPARAGSRAVGMVDAAVDALLNDEVPHVEAFFDVWGAEGLWEHIEPAWLRKLLTALEPQATAEAQAPDAGQRRAASRVLFLLTAIEAFDAGRTGADASTHTPRLRALIARTEAACDDPRYASQSADFCFRLLDDRPGYLTHSFVAAVQQARADRRAGEEVFRHGWYVEENELLEGLTDADVRAMHAGLLAGLARIPRLADLGAEEGVDVVDAVLVPTYEDVWKPLLRADDPETPFGDEVIAAATALLAYIGAPEPPSLLFDPAYQYQQRGDAVSDAQAEAFYRRLLDNEPHAPAANNLALLLDKRGTPEAQREAAELAEFAAQLAPKDNQIARNASVLREKAMRSERASAAQRAQDEAVRRAAVRREDFLRSAVARFPQVDSFKRQILAALSVVSGYDGIEHLAQLSGVDARSLPTHLRKLVELGMVEDGPGGVRLNPHIAPLIERERTHAMATKLIRADESLAIKPVFNSRQEAAVYGLVIGLFPNHLVLPNMGLQAIFQYERMKGLLDSDTFGYYLRASVDLCVVSTATYFPIVAFEVDSPYHDAERQQANDAKKDLIFRRGGVDLIRLRAYGRPSVDGMRGDIIRALVEYGNLHVADRRVATMLRELNVSALSADAGPGSAAILRGDTESPPHRGEG